jgi:DNA invertase Pin-like site-specific DNA recombinase
MTMAIPRPSAITAARLQKKAVVYIRQSSLAQLRDHIGSTAAQLELVDLARAWGWPESRIEPIDADLGMSAATSGTKRTGFQTLLEMIERGDVGIVFVRDHTRLARNLLDAALFHAAAKRRGILIYADGRLYDAASDSDADDFSFMLQGVLAVRDNANRVRTFAAARAAKARQGHAVTSRPSGYIKGPHGTWLTDPDPNICDALGRAFPVYLEEKSLTKAAKRLSEGLGFPRRMRGEVRFSPITAQQLYAILRNELYTGDYLYRRFKTTPASESAPRRLERRPQEDWIRVENHHHAFVSREDFQRVQDLLRSQRLATRPLVGKGNALLQGMLRCAICKKSLHTHYDGRDGVARTATYRCRRSGSNGKNGHIVALPARLFDPKVAAELLAALTPIEIDSALEVLDGEAKRHGAALRMRRHQLQRADDAVEEAHEAYREARNADPIVKVDLEARYSAALQERDRLKAETTITAAPYAPITQEERGELIRLIDDIQGIWSAPTTTPEDRKRILRAVISEILVHDVTSDAAELEIVWIGGFRQPLRVLLPSGVEARIRDLTLQGKRTARIAEELNAAGVLTASGRPITTNLVAQKQGRQGLRLKNDRLLAKQIVSRGIMDKTPRPDIISQLQAQVPRLGPWDAQRLSEYIRDLQRRPSAAIERLPDVLPAEQEKEKVLAITERALTAGKDWKEIAQLLNDAGHKPPRGMAFTPVQIRLLYLRARGLKSFRLPARSQLKDMPA